ncbi:MAG: hypothetical protein HC888_15935 [Candidatus Competibacteraceae bacterium]|nr:hypothetical protein [Candidatus Competibacteraceae bacterium]
MSESTTAPARAQLPPVLRILVALWRGKFPIATGTGVTIAVALLATMAMPASFESTAVLVLLPSPVKQSGSEMVELMSKGLSVADYEILLQSDGVLTQTAEEVRALGTWPEEDLEEVSEIESLRSRLSLEVTVTQKSAYGSAYSPVIELIAKAGSPAQAKDLANAWASVAEKLSAELSRRGQSGSIDFLREKFASANTELENVHASLRDFESISMMSWKKPA